MPDERSVFLSYASPDRERARLMADYLKSKNVPVWWDRDLLPGDRFRAVIDQQLDSAACVIVLFTAAALESRWVQEEAEHADRRGVLIPIKIAIAEPPKPFGGLHVADLTDWSGEDNDETRKILAKIEILRQRPQRDRYTPQLSDGPSAAAGPMAAAADRSIQNVSLFEDWGTGIGKLLATIKSGSTRQSSALVTGSVCPPVIDVHRRRRVGGFAVIAFVVVVLAVVLAQYWDPDPKSPKLQSIPGAIQRDGLPYVPIPAGDVEVGCDPGESECSGGKRVLRVAKAFWMGQTEVPAKTFARFKGDSQPPSQPYWPATGMSCQDAESYCKHVGGRLPSGTEWEYASAKGSTAYPADSPAPGNEPGKVERIARFAPNKLGIYDLDGNAWEWTSEKSPKDKASHIVRRGSAKQLTSSFEGGPDTGFRCVLDR